MKKNNIQRGKTVENIPLIISNKKLEKKKKMTTFPITKIEQPVYYSNLVLIEDMTYENTNYYISANGFTSNEIELQSSLHNKLFNYSNCAFKIYPKTYSINKDKIIDYVKHPSSSLNTNQIEKINFKFTNELYNNLDILETKFREPIRYGDIVMLMHYVSHKFIKYIPNTNNVILTPHDSECTLFRIEPHQDLMLFDDYIVKTGQAIRIVPAPVKYGMSEAIGYLGLQFPYERYRISESDRFNSKTYKYMSIPSIRMGKFKEMKWRFTLYETLTHNEELIKFGDWVRIEHCGLGKGIALIGDRTDEDGKFVLTAEQEKELEEKYNAFLNEKEEEDIRKERKCSSYIQYVNKIFERRDGGNIPLPPPMKKPDIKYNVSLSDNEKDVNAIFIIESAIPLSRKRPLLSHYDTNYKGNDIFLITNHKNIFRLRHFLSGKFLSLHQSGKKFTLIQDPQYINDIYLTSENYKNSLFGTKSCIMSKSNVSHPTKKDFFRIYHINTNSYVIYSKNHLRLSPNTLDREIFQFSSFNSEFILEMRFVSQMFTSLRYIICSKNIMENKPFLCQNAGEKIIKKINKFLLNKSRQKLKPNLAYGSIDHERQNYLLQFSYHHVIFRHFFQNYWLKDNYRNLKAIYMILNDINMEYFFNEFHMKKRESNIFTIYKFSEKIFEFCYFFVKNNKINKNNLFDSALHFLIFFIPISKYALLALIEVFRNNTNAIQKIKSLSQSSPITSSICDIYKYFFCMKLRNFTSNIFILLIIDLIKISHNKHNNYTKYVVDNKEQIILSINKKEDYFHLLMTLCTADNISFIEMQNKIIAEIIERDITDNYFINNFVKTIDENDIKSFLISLLDKNDNDVLTEAIKNEDLFNMAKILDLDQTKNFIFDNQYAKFCINIQIFNKFFTKKNAL